MRVSKMVLLLGTVCSFSVMDGYGGSEDESVGEGVRKKESNLVTIITHDSEKDLDDCVHPRYLLKNKMSIIWECAHKVIDHHNMESISLKKLKIDPQLEDYLKKNIKLHPSILKELIFQQSSYHLGIVGHMIQHYYDNHKNDKEVLESNYTQWMTQQYKDDIRNALKDAADNNYVISQYLFGVHCYKGLSGNNEIKIMKDYFEKADLQGHTESQYLLGSMYKDYSYHQMKKNINPIKEKELAIFYLTKAVEKGHLKAQYGLGVCYVDFCRDFDKAIIHFEESFKKGYVQSSNGLSLCYKNKQDYETQFKWAQIAANQNDAVAQYNLGVLHEHGQGTEKNLSLALECYEKAKQLGYAVAEQGINNLKQSNPDFFKEQQSCIIQ